MKTKHTKGNWRWERSFLSITTAESGTSTEKNICTINTYVNSGISTDGLQEWEANAKLIAAAPELLAAAKEAVSAIDSLIYEHKDSNPSYRGSLLQIKNAIKKATE